MKWFFVFIVWIYATASFANLSSETIDDFITSEMPNSGATGLSYAVVDNGEFYSGERGEILLGSGREISPDTPFAIGSISKSFTALGIMQFVETGQLDLETAISKYLEIFSDSPARSITVRQLLSHTSGYSTLQGNDTLFEQSHSKDSLLLQVQRIAQWTPAYGAGTQWDYSNANYYILGALIETLSGQDFDDYIETEILEPLGMKHSFVADGARYDFIARGHTPWFGGKRPVKAGETHRMSAPVGGIIASARDVARYMQVMMNGADDVISAKSKVEMMRPASDTSPFYGFGWYVDTYKGTVSHTGLTPGVETLAIMRPSEKIGVVVLVNSGSGMGFGESAPLFNGISGRALKSSNVNTGDTGAGGRWSRKALFLLFALLPLFFLTGIIQAWRQRANLRKKSGLFGAFSLWFPLLMMVILAWTSVFLIPNLFGVSIRTLRLFSPDLALALIATAVTGVIWAVFRLVVFYSGSFVSD